MRINASLGVLFAALVMTFAAPLSVQAQAAHGSLTQEQAADAEANNITNDSASAISGGYGSLSPEFSNYGDLFSYVYSFCILTNSINADIRIYDCP